MLLLLLALITGIAGIGGLTTNANYRVYFDQSDPAMLDQNRFEHEFARRDALLLIITPPPSNPQQTVYQQSLEDYEIFAQQLLSLPQITEARGLNDLSKSEGNPTNRKNLQQQYIAGEAQSGLIELDIKLNDEKSAAELSQLAESIRTIAAEALPVHTGVEFGGPLALNMAYSDVIKHDLKVFIPGLILLTGLMLFIALGHIGLSISLILLGVLAVAVSSGIAGWLGFEMAAINAFGPVVIVGLSLATQLHLVLACVRQLNNKPNADTNADTNAGTNAGTKADTADGAAEAGVTTVKTTDTLIKAGLAECRWPFTISCITTAAGFAALSLSPSPPVQKLGITVAFGVLTIYLIGLIVLPVLLARLDLTQLARRYARWQQLLQSLAHKLDQSRKWVTGLFVLLLIITLPALSQLEINDFVYGYFPDDDSFSKSIATLDSDYSGSVQLHYKIDAGSEDGIFQQQHLLDTQRWIDWLRQQAEVNAVSSITEHIPKTSVPTATLKRAIESSTARRLANGDYSAESITVSMNSTTAGELLEFDKRVARQLDSYPNRPNYTGGLGSDLVFAKLGFRNAASMFTTLALALVSISLLLGIFFKSARLCCIGLVCNAVPLVIVYGFWALSGGYISLGSAVVMGMIMGIIVDDTVHMLYRYHFMKNIKKSIKKNNESNSSSQHMQENKIQATESRWVADMLADTGPALLVSSIALIAGLAVGLLSSFRPVMELAMLSIAVIFLATVTDLILLPALLNFRRNKARI